MIFLASLLFGTDKHDQDHDEDHQHYQYDGCERDRDKEIHGGGTKICGVMGRERQDDCSCAILSQCKHTVMSLWEKKECAIMHQVLFKQFLQYFYFGQLQLMVNPHCGDIQSMEYQFS